MHYFTHIYAIEMFQKAKLHTPQEENYVKSKKKYFSPRSWLADEKIFFIIE